MPTPGANPSRLTRADGANPVAVAVLVLLGLAALAHPLVLWPHYSQTSYGVYGVERTDGASVELDCVVDYADLPAAARESFDGARRGEHRRRGAPI